jgi:hypothetical protein
MKNEQNNHHLVEVASFEGMMEAEILKAKLESFGVPSMLKYEAVGHVLGITTNGLGLVQVMVSPEHFDKAKVLIDEDDHADEGEKSPS